MLMRVYDTPLWHAAREHALCRDGRRCSVARLIGGTCHPRLHVHHLVPVSEGGDPYGLDNLLTVCQTHHPMLERLRRFLLASDTESQPYRCRHRHPYPQGREECERRWRARQDARATRAA